MNRISDALKDRRGKISVFEELYPLDLSARPYDLYSSASNHVMFQPFNHLFSINWYEFRKLVEQTAEYVSNIFPDS
jgi:hypothetical protein